MAKINSKLLVHYGFDNCDLLFIACSVLTPVNLLLLGRTFQNLACQAQHFFHCSACVLVVKFCVKTQDATPLQF